MRTEWAVPAVALAVAGCLGTPASITEANLRVPAIPLDPYLERAWSEAVTVFARAEGETGTGSEPIVAVDADGVIYYSPVSNIFRSTDGGATFEDISPSLTEALPVYKSDTSISIAPTGALWFSRTVGYGQSTIGCTSLDKGDSWTCSSLAIPGETDRMWIVGLSDTEGYLQTNEGLYHHAWAKTIDGSRSYQPHRTTDTALAVRNGNMVYDAGSGAVLQVEVHQEDVATEIVSGLLPEPASVWLNRVDGDGLLVETWDTGLSTSGDLLPWIAIHDGVLWVAFEQVEDVSATPAVARSFDLGRTWEAFSLATQAKAIEFPYVAAGPGGRVAVFYYGSDQPNRVGDDPLGTVVNGGVWSLYVTEANEGLAKVPPFSERRVVEKVHEGNICTGFACERQGDDPNARFAGDLMGIWIDTSGFVHLSYNDDADGRHKAQYLGQIPVATT